VAVDIERLNESLIQSLLLDSYGLSHGTSLERAVQCKGIFCVIKQWHPLIKQ